MTKATEYYVNGYIRPTAMAQLPDWALREFLYRHAGPAGEAALDEAAHRGWSVIEADGSVLETLRLRQHTTKPSIADGCSSNDA